MDSRDQMIGLLYEAAVFPRLWPKALDLLSRGMDGIGAHLLTFDKERRVPLSSALGGPAMAPDLMQRYAEGYAHVDPLLPACFRATPNRRAMLCHEILSEESVATSAYYQELVIPSGLRYQAGWVLESSSRRQIVLSIHKRKAPFEAHKLAPWEPVIGHLRRAAQLSANLTPFLAGGDLLRQAIDHCQMTCLITDSTARVLDYSLQASALLERGSVLKLRDQGRLGTGTAYETKQLHHLIARAAFGCGGILRIAGAGGCPYYLLEIVPGGVRADNPFDRRFDHCSLVFVSTPNRLSPLDPKRIQIGLNCTRAEAEVASYIASGKTPKQIADRRRVTLNTVRTQIRMLLNHTGLNRTADLISYLHRIS